MNFTLSNLNNKTVFTHSTLLFFQCKQAVRTLRALTSFLWCHVMPIGHVTWTANKKEILIDYKGVKRGSRTFLDVLSHEAIHLAQSCYGGSKNSYPKRIGLPLEFSKDLETNLSHKLYKENSEEGI